MQLLLEKFNGIEEKEYKLKGEERRDPLVKKFRISRLPEETFEMLHREKYFMVKCFLKCSKSNEPTNARAEELTNICTSKFC